mgnify:CR=1 FL=1
MDFIETVEYMGITYCVRGERIVVDESFGHAFGIEVGYYIEVKILEIFEAFDEYGEDSYYDNTDEQLLCELTQILEEKFNA